MRLSPANAVAGASDDEIRAWFAPHAELRILDLGGLAGRVQMPLDDGDTLDDGAKMGGGDDDGLGDEQMPAGETSNASRDTPAALTRRLMRSVSFREEIARHVRQQVELATPFECLCVQGAADALDDHLLTPASLSAIVNDFRARVSQDKTVFVAGYRMDIEGRILPFQANWDRAYALALYDWNGSGLSCRQFSSVINRLISQRAEKVHFAMGFGGADGQGETSATKNEIQSRRQRRSSPVSIFYGIRVSGRRMRMVHAAAATHGTARSAVATANT